MDNIEKSDIQFLQASEEDHGLIKFMYKLAGSRMIGNYQDDIPENLGEI